ncbi:magnesium-translocating P-type ATPase [Chromobacterium sphagni]|uniref:magnesium-translocating P-type ATPase n=1 Tax=Chromobacterium sphagni TaxID=1903179 RepID=UPI000ADE0523|nr:magnesium-translocating P-type ATPase [Chromobacterium sphagni]
MTKHNTQRSKNRGFIATPGKHEGKTAFRLANEAQLPLEETFKRLRSQPDGLSAMEAAHRLQQDGPNEVAHDKPPHPLIQLFQAFKNPFVMVLIVLGVISYVMDIAMAPPEDQDWTKVIILATMISISGLLRFWQEFRSAKAAEKLKSLVRNTATVQRRPSAPNTPVRMEVPMAELVVGDIIHLQAGDMIPADIRLLESRDLFISQAVLTGEALPVEKYDTLGAVAAKSADQDADGASDLLDLPNACFMGTNVVSGTARALVVATGTDTYFGSLARNVVSRKRIETSFDKGVNSVSWLLIRFMLVMVPIVFMINGVTKGDWMSALTFALAVAVGLTPEMLPMIVSANLAKGAVAMARRKVVVKRLNSVQNFGAMDVLCTDKTGTLTQDKIILEHHYNIHGLKDETILQLAWLNSFHQSGMKNLMDIAVVEHANELGERVKLQQYAKVDELPFDFERRRLSVIVEDGGQQLMVSKGAVEEMLAVCSHVQDGDVVKPLDQAERANLLRRSQEYNAEGYRVLVVATRDIPAAEQKRSYKTSDEAGLVVRGFLTFFDPPRTLPLQPSAR